MKKLFSPSCFFGFHTFISPAQYTSPFCQMCWVPATVGNTDTACQVDASGTYSGYYDDGTAENYFAWVVPGGMVAVKFPAVYESETDYCESAPFTAKDNPDEDYVCVTLVGNQEHKNDQRFRVNIFPNPAEDKVSINSTEPIRQIELINYTGQTVLLKQMNDKEVTLNVNGLKPGIYIAQVKTEKGIEIKKIVLK